MPQYLVAVYHPDDYDPSVETEATIEDIHALNRELLAASARRFACGLSPAGSAKSLRVQPDGKVLVTDGPYTETKEHRGGFWILEAADLEEALAWSAQRCRRLPYVGRGARDSFQSGPEGSKGIVSFAATSEYGGWLTFDFCGWRYHRLGRPTLLAFRRVGQPLLS
jgi:hypothetical protein